MYRFKKQNDEFRDDIAILSDILKDTTSFIHGFIGDYLYFYAEKVDDKRVEIIDESDFMYSVVIEPELKDISPHYELVNKRVLEKIRSLYSLEEELKIQRLRDIEPDEFNDFYNWCESCRAWGREQKNLMGFITE